MLDKRLFRRQMGRCFFCLTEMEPTPWTPTQPYGYTRDHLWPRSLGHTLHKNKVLACFSCNTKKGDRRPTEREQMLYRLLVASRVPFFEALTRVHAKFDAEAKEKGHGEVQEQRP